MITQGKKDKRLFLCGSSTVSAVSISLLFHLTACLLPINATASSSQTNPVLTSSTIEEMESSQKGPLQCGKSSIDGVEGKSLADGEVLPRAKSQKKQLTCMSSVEDIHDAWVSENVVIVDVRRSRDYQAFHIPSSLNLTPFSIKSKHFLKKKPLILVNEGHYLGQVDVLCNQLKSQGFQDVKVMKGGLLAWRDRGYELFGDRIATTKLDQLSPADLVSSLSERDWRIIDLDHSLNNTERFLPESHVIHYASGGTEVVKAVNQKQRQFSPTALSGFLVVSRDGTGYAQVAKLLKLTDAEDIFYLSGGIDRFNRYLQTHSSLIERLSRGFREQHRCSG